jgi:squalene synthase HpnC
MYSGQPHELILIALQQTVRQFAIPPDPFLKLIDAFEQDQRIFRYETYDQLVAYCQRSADPVGHLVLYLCGYSDPERQRLADFTCTALQLTNFWQDVANDLDRGRIYIPREDMRRFDVPEEDIVARRFTPAFAAMMQFEVNRTEDLFRQGEALLPQVNRRVRTDVALYGRGGRAILQAIRRIDCNTLQHRPTLGRFQKFTLLARYLLGT